MNILILASVALLPMSSSEPRVEPSPSIRASIESAILSSSAAPAKHVQTPAKPQRSTGRKIAGGVIGAVGGFVAGAIAGGLIFQQGDLPNMHFAVLGGALGAFAGAGLGAKYL